MHTRRQFRVRSSERGALFSGRRELVTSHEFELGLWSFIPSLAKNFTPALGAAQQGICLFF